jgi:hypothetical protein
MKASTTILRGFVWMIIAVFMLPAGIPAQDSGEPNDQPDRFTKEELVQMLAPIALYPDPLIAQILMASTYPLELVEAERWVRQHKEMKGDALNDALKDKPWDPSVKSLCHVPDILFAMSEKLDQTRKLGDAYLSQEDEVMATIQDLRHKAKEQGNLSTTEKQQVIIEKDVIRVEPANPEVVYVPVYDPLYAYGPWWYPAYPPYYWYYPPGFVVTSGYIGYGPGIFLGFGWSSWAWFDWHVHHIHVDYHKTGRFHRYHGKRDFDRPYWRHDPVHRKGVAYRDRGTSERFGIRSPQMKPTSPETRGYPGGRMERRDWRPSGSAIERRGIPVTPGVSPKPGTIQRTQGRDTPFRGIGDANFERRAAERGSESRRSIDMRRSSTGTQRQGGEIRRQGDSIRQPGGGSWGGGKGGGFRR